MNLTEDVTVRLGNELALQNLGHGRVDYIVSFGTAQIPQGQVFGWQCAFAAPNVLLGQPPILHQHFIVGIYVTDDDIEQAVKTILENIGKLRSQLLSQQNGGQANN
jgi:hypothetical protein